DSSSKSSLRGKMLAKHLGIDFSIKNITETLVAIGCYQWRDKAIQRVFPEYTSQWKNKITISNAMNGQINHFTLVVENPEGEQFSQILGLNEYLTIIAATNYKQRVRKSIEYFHADRLNYAVIGTPNKLEYDQGFFVKNGDGSADIKPIAHLYKSQVYALARHLELPNEICRATPTTDTYSLSQGQDEFYFSLPYQKMDIALYYKNNQFTALALADKLNLTLDQAEYVYNDIDKKRSTTHYQHVSPYLLDEVSKHV
ncbi:MAG TPA: NAD(+) synthase, partial [Saprospiraceae bacterium]|nr:NAD(+) synthase [Saprospiraceae bacterium]